MLADEINRATPKAQSALLEAMEERQVTADGTTYSLPAPFFVVATRNPAHQIGTFPLPESQLDRFLMQIELGYPEPERRAPAARERRTPRARSSSSRPCCRSTRCCACRSKCQKVHVSEPLLDYVQALLAYTRKSGEFVAGLSPRGGIALVRAAQAWALVSGHAGVHPEDLQAVLGSVVAHRLAARARQLDRARRRSRRGDPRGRSRARERRAAARLAPCSSASLAPLERWAAVVGTPTPRRRRALRSR